MSDVFSIADSDFQGSDPAALRFEWLDAAAAQPNAANWRIHPPSQSRALNKLIFTKQGVGWAGVVLVNDRRTADGWTQEEAVPTVIDGHDRQQLAQRQNQKMPAVIGHWTKQQENMLLATFDPIGALAQTDAQAWAKLLQNLESEDEDIQLLIGTLQEKSAVIDNLDFGALPDIDEDQAARGMRGMLVKIMVNDPAQYEDLVQQIQELIEVNGYAAKLER